MKKFLIVGNWKMNFTSNEAISFVNELKTHLSDLNLENIDVLLCVPFTNLHPIKPLLDHNLFHLGAQNMHFESKGAFTGEISPLMLLGAACEYVILGHSERRQFFFEDNEILLKKINTALNHNLIPIFCIGEILSQREANQTFQVLEHQLNLLHQVPNDLLSKIIIAYEPVWAIGTGLNATNEQIEETHLWINNFLFSHFGVNVKILYGGSMNDGNAKDILETKNVSGGLIGGASLKVPQFLNIIKTAIDLSFQGK